MRKSPLVYLKAQARKTVKVAVGEAQSVPDSLVALCYMVTLSGIPQEKWLTHFVHEFMQHNR